MAGDGSGVAAEKGGFPPTRPLRAGRRPCVDERFGDSPGAALQRSRDGSFCPPAVQVWLERASGTANCAAGTEEFGGCKLLVLGDSAAFPPLPSPSREMSPLCPPS